MARLLEAGMNVALGTDGVAGNNDLNPPGKGVAGDPGTLPERQVLHMVTLGDTRALELGGKTGSLVAGKAVDINTIDHPAPVSYTHLTLPTILDV